MMFSIIIPHKNSLSLLTRCLKSIPSRGDVEIIIVDDDSSPMKVDFDKLRSLKDKRTRIIETKDGLGAGYARNVGLKYARGKWLLFADADDYFTSELSDFLNDYKDYECDCIFFKTDVSEFGGVYDFLNNNVNRYLDGSELNKIRYENVTPWCKMVRRDLLIKHKISFEEVIAANDVLFATKVGFYSETISVDTRTVYHYSKTDNSLVNLNNAERMRTRIKVVARQNLFLRRHGLYKYRGGVGTFFRYLYAHNKIQYYIMGLYYAFSICKGKINSCENRIYYNDAMRLMYKQTMAIFH